jgi:hypothetical protein
MFRLPVLVALVCICAGASTMSWRWDVFQPTSRYFINVGDITNWLPFVDAEEKPIELDGELPDEDETVPGGLTIFDLSSLYGSDHGPLDVLAS